MRTRMNGRTHGQTHGRTHAPLGLDSQNALGVTSHSGEEPQEEETKANTDEGARNTAIGPKSEMWPANCSRFLGESVHVTLASHQQLCFFLSSSWLHLKVIPTKYGRNEALPQLGGEAEAQRRTFPR